jgi:hypothetical protein
MSSWEDEQLREEPPARLLLDRVQRNILAGKPRVTKFPINFHPEPVTSTEQQQQQEVQQPASPEPQTAPLEPQTAPLEPHTAPLEIHAGDECKPSTDLWSKLGCWRFIVHATVSCIVKFTVVVQHRSWFLVCRRFTICSGTNVGCLVISYFRLFWCK